MNISQNNNMPFFSYVTRFVFPLCVASLLTDIASAEDSRPNKPNIVVFVADDMGWGDSIKWYSVYRNKTLFCAFC